MYFVWLRLLTIFRNLQIGLKPCCQQIHIGLAKKLAGKKVVLDAFLLSTQKCSGKTFLGGILIRLFLVTFLVGIVWFGKEISSRG